MSRPRLFCAILFGGFLAAGGVRAEVGGAVPGTGFAVGPQEVRELYTREDTKAMKLLAWPDGTMGVLPGADGGFTFFAASATQRTFVRSSGPLDAPASRVEKIPFRVRGAYDYFGGGPIVSLGDRTLLMAHAEQFRGGRKLFHSSLILTAQSGGGMGFEELGPVVQSHMPDGDLRSAVELGSGPMVIHGDHLYIYHRDVLQNGNENGLTASRAPLDAVRASVGRGEAPAFFKWFNGDWSQPALGGESSPMEQGNPELRWMDVKYSAALGRFVCVAAACRKPGEKAVNLRLTLSEDGIRWSRPVWLTESPDEELFYPTIVELDRTPRGGVRWGLYHTASRGGGFRRPNDGRLVLRTFEVFPGGAAEARPAQAVNP